MNVLWPNGSTTPPQLNSPYGPRESFWTPGGWTNPFHYGQDCTGFSMNRSIADGVVVYVGYNGGYGNHVRVRHDDGYESSHSHGATGGFRVSVGQRVRAGDDLMVQGTTGRSTGVHDHLEVYLPNGDTTDPVRYIRDRLSGAASTGGSEPLNQSEEDDMLIIYSQHLERLFLIGDGGITHLVGDDVAKAYNAIGIPGNRFTNQLGKNDFRMVVEALGISYERTRLLKPGERLEKDTRTNIVENAVAVLDAGNVPWGPDWA